MKHHILLVHSQTLRLNDIWDLGLREAVDGTSLQWREQPSVAGHFAFPIMNSDCVWRRLWSIVVHRQEIKRNKQKQRENDKKKRKEKKKTLTTHAYSFHFLGQFLSLLLFLLLLLLSNTTPQGLVLGPLFGRFFLLPGGRLLEAPGLLQLQ